MKGIRCGAVSESNATPPCERPAISGALRIAGYGGAAFGVATIVGGGLVLFGPEAARAAAGRAVPFVVWTNFLGGFAYVAAGLGLARARRWAIWAAAGIASATGLVGLAFAAHVHTGGAFEARTVVALAARAGLWAGVAVWASRRLGAGRTI